MAEWGAGLAIGRGWWEGHPLLMDSLSIDEKGLGDEKGLNSLSREAELGWGQSISGGPQTLPEPELRPWFKELVRFFGALGSVEYQLSYKMEAQKASCQPPMRKNKKISHPKITQIPTSRASWAVKALCIHRCLIPKDVLHLGYCITLPDIVLCVLI